MKKLLTAVLVLSMVLGLCFVPSVSAASTIKEITLFETDFENDTVGSAPKALSPYGDKIADNATVYEEADGNKYADTLEKGTKKRFRMLFNEAVSSGTVVAEFDLNTISGAVALGMVYKNSNTTYQKWPFYVTGEPKDYAVKGFTATGGNPPGTEVTGKTVTFTKDGSSDNLTFKVNQWQHYKVIFDFDNQTVTAYIDNEKSSTIGGYEYFGKNNDAIAGLAFYCSEPDTETYKPLNKFDNIKVYKEYGNYLIDKDYEDGEVGATAQNSKNINATSKYLDFNSANGGAVRYMFAGSTVINKNNADKLFVEFDTYTGFGGVGFAILDSATTSYGSYDKYIFSEGTKYSSPNYGAGVYCAKGGDHPKAGGKTIYTKAGTATKMALSKYKWQHVKVEIDLQQSKSTVTVDGEKSNAVSVGYLENINLNGIALHWATALSDADFADTTKITAEEKAAYIDNLKVYTIADKVYNVGIEDFTPAYTAGTTVTVNYDFTVTDLSSKNVELIVASYNGGELCEVNIEKIENVNASGTKKASLTLTKDCDEIRAFAWENGTLVPLAQHVTKNK